MKNLLKYFSFLILFCTFTSCSKSTYYGVSDVNIINKDSSFHENLRGVYFEFTKNKVIYYEGFYAFELNLKNDSVFVPTRKLKYKLTITDTELILKRPGHVTTFKLIGNEGYF
jgi:hypothetical protein